MVFGKSCKRDYVENFPTVDGSCFTFFRGGETYTKESKRRFARLRYQDIYTWHNFVRPYYTRFLRETGDHFNLSIQTVDSIIYLFKKVQRVYDIPTHRKIHISLLVASIFCVASSKEVGHYIPLKQLLAYCESKGHRMKLKYIYTLFKKYPLLMEYYVPCSIHDRIKYYRVAIFSQFIDNPEIKIYFRNHIFPITYSDYTKQLQTAFDQIILKIHKSFRTQSRNPHRLCCGVLYLANAIVTKQNKKFRFLSQDIFGKTLNVPSNYIRDGVCEVNRLLKG